MSENQPGMGTLSQGELLNNSRAEGKIVFNYKGY